MKQKKIANTNIFIQGVSSIRELSSRTTDKYMQFVTDKLVNLAVRRGENPKFLINANICLASDFTKSLIRYQDYCYTLDDMKMKKDEIFNLKKNLINNAIIRSNKISNIVDRYHAWYELYKSKNTGYQKKLAQEKKETLARQKREEAIAQRDKDIDKNEDIRSSSDNIFELTDDMVGQPKEIMSEDEFKNDMTDEDDAIPQIEVKDNDVSPLLDVSADILPVVEAPQAVEETMPENAAAEVTENAVPEVTEAVPEADVQVPEAVVEEIKEVTTEIATEMPAVEADTAVQDVKEAMPALNETITDEVLPQAESHNEVAQEIAAKADEKVDEAVKEIIAEPVETVKDVVEVPAEKAILPEISVDNMPVAGEPQVEDKTATDNEVKADKADELDLF